MLERENYILAEVLGRDDAKVKTLVWCAGRNPKMQDSVRLMLRSLARKRGIDPDDPPAFGLPQCLSPSDYPLGQAKCGKLLGGEVGPSQKDIDAGGGMGVFGVSGVGKTTLVKIFILAFTGKKI